MEAVAFHILLLVEIHLALYQYAYINYKCFNTGFWRVYDLLQTHI